MFADPTWHIAATKAAQPKARVQELVNANHCLRQAIMTRERDPITKMHFALRHGCSPCLEFRGNRGEIVRQSATQAETLSLQLASEEAERYSIRHVTAYLRTGSQTTMAASIRDQ